MIDRDPNLDMLTAHIFNVYTLLSLEKLKRGTKGGRARMGERDGGRTDFILGLQTDAMMGYSKKAAVCMPGGEPSPAHTLISHVQT